MWIGNQNECGHCLCLCVSAILLPFHTIYHVKRQNLSQFSRTKSLLTPIFFFPGLDHSIQATMDSADWQKPPTLVRPLYQYQPLQNPEDIRLIYLHPGSSKDEVSCTIVPISRESGPIYECLSYTWGDGKQTKTLHCGESILGVTSNLYSALHSLRHVDRDRILWVDAICINQGDGIERNRQVGMMRRIYSGSSEVVVWLGDEIGSDVMAIDLIRQFAIGLSEDPQKPRLDLTSTATRTTLLRRLAQDKHLCLAIVQFLQKPWFRRVWIIQEVAVSSKASIVCGSHKVSWEALSSMTSYFRSNHLDNIVGTSSATWTTILTMGWVRDARTKQNTGIPPTLLQLLEATQLCHCTDPRDRVFALFGIAPDAYSAGLAPNYSLECTEVYQAAAIYFLFVRRNLTCLSFCGQRLRASALDLPSWVPNWDLKSSQAYLSPLTDQGFKAGKGTTFKMSICDAAQVLTLSGFIVDTIKDVGTKSLTWTTTDAAITSLEAETLQAHNIREGLKECDSIASIANPYPTGQDFEETIWRSLICNRLATGHIPGSEYAVTIPLYRYVIEHIDELLNHQLAHVDVDFLQRNQALTDNYAAAIDKWTSGRVFCATNGRLLGWVPPGTTAGDLVCIFSGTEVPYVLRQDPTGHHQLIGDCYIHGLMDGEAMARGDLREQDLKIR